MAEPEDITQRLSEVFETNKELLDRMAGSVATFTDKVAAAFTKTEQAFLRVADVAQMLGGSTADIKKYQDTLEQLGVLQRSLTNLSKSRSKGEMALAGQQNKMQVQLGIVRKAMQKYGEELHNLGVGNAAAAISIRNLFKEVSTGIDTEKAKVWKAKMVSMFEISPKAEKLVRTFGPNMTKAASESTAGMIKFRLAALSLTILGAAFSFLGSTIMRALRGTVGIHRTLMGAIRLQDISILNSASIYGQAAVAGGLYNIKQEEQIQLLNALTSGYALSINATRDLAGTQTFHAVQAMAYGKALNLSTAQTIATITTMKLFGTSLGNMPGAFLDIKGAATAAGLTMTDMTSILNRLAPVSLAVKDANMRILNLFAKFGDVTRGSLIAPMQEFLGTERGMKASAEAMTKFAQAAEQLSLPHVLAFGGGMGLGGATSLTDAFTNAMAKTRPEIMVNMLRQVVRILPGGQKEMTGQLAIFLAQMTGARAEIAFTMADRFLSMESDTKKARTQGQQEFERVNKQQVENFALLSSAIENPMERLIGLVKDILTWIATIAGRFFLGGSLPGMIEGGPRRRPI